MENKRLNRLVQVCLDLMDIAAEDKGNFERRLGLGYLAFSSIIKSGIAEIAELKYQIADYKSSYELEKKDNEELRDLLGEVFGDRDIDTLNEDTLNDILEYARRKTEEFDDA